MNLLLGTFSLFLIVMKMEDSVVFDFHFYVFEALCCFYDELSDE
jgi:hypothetical protein